MLSSASTASRFFSCEHAPDELFWQELNGWQLEQFYRLPRRGRRGDVVFKLDLTCIEKTGKQIPFARVFNRRYGIQMVVLHACVEGLRFPLGYRVYRGKGRATVVDLALEPHFCRLERWLRNFWRLTSTAAPVNTLQSEVEAI